MAVPTELVIVAWLVRVSGHKVDCLCFPKLSFQFRQAIGAENRYYKPVLDLSAETFPDVCMCGNIISATGANLRMVCPACQDKWNDNRWFHSNELARAARAIRTVSQCDFEILKLVYAKAIWLESRRKINVNVANQTTSNT